MAESLKAAREEGQRSAHSTSSDRSGGSSGPDDGDADRPRGSSLDGKPRPKGSSLDGKPRRRESVLILQKQQAEKAASAVNDGRINLEKSSTNEDPFKVRGPR